MAPPAEKPAALCVDALVEEPIAGAGDAARASSAAGSSAAEVAIVEELVDVAGGASGSGTAGDGAQKSATTVAKPKA
eukprot:851640-Alexandrium_andersonii.AAC.1